jgi:hypothetical protein
VPVRIRPAIASPRSVSAVNTEPARPVAQDEVETQCGSVSLVVGNDSCSAFGFIRCRRAQDLRPRLAEARVEPTAARSHSRGGRLNSERASRQATIDNVGPAGAEAGALTAEEKCDIRDIIDGDEAALGPCNSGIEVDSES